VWAGLGGVGRGAWWLGLLWGARVGCSSRCPLIVLKALPVLIIGGFSSVAGTIVGGLIVGASEKLAEVYLGPPVGGGIEKLVPVRAGPALPPGAAHRPVRRAAGGARLMSVAAGFEIHPLRLRGARLGPAARRGLALAAVALVAFGVVPALGNDYWFSAILIPFLVLSLAGIGLNILTVTPASSRSVRRPSWRWGLRFLQLPAPCSPLPLLASFALGGLTAGGGRCGLRPAKPAIKGFY
jgi:hypothetical protein